MYVVSYTVEEDNVGYNSYDTKKDALDFIKSMAALGDGKDFHLFEELAIEVKVVVDVRVLGE